MKVWGVNETQLEICADEVGVKLYELRPDGRALRFGIRPTGERDEYGNYKYQRTSSSGFNPERRVHAVCWHGHRDFMRAIFKREPNARIKTMWADYKGSQDFERKFGATAHLNVGSMMYPAYAGSVCKCHTGSWLVDLSNRPGIQSYKVKQSTFAACPHVIFDVSHYRPDGSCKCDDPDEQARMIAEWGYAPSDFVTV